MNDDTNTQKNLTQAYEEPLLVYYGDLAELTQASGTSSMADGGNQGSFHKTS